jgi:hypothetical protein
LTSCDRSGATRSPERAAANRYFQKYFERFRLAFSGNGR